MRFIPSKVHGALDYIIGLLLILAPALFGFSDVPAARWIAIVVGAGAICYSLLTGYEMGLVKIIPLRIHLVLDACSGLLLLVSPWLFGFADYVWAPHVIVGLLEIGAALMTVTVPTDNRLATARGHTSSSTTRDSDRTDRL